MEARARAGRGGAGRGAGVRRSANAPRGQPASETDEIKFGRQPNRRSSTDTHTHPRHHCKPSSAFQTRSQAESKHLRSRALLRRVRRRLLLDGATQNAGGALQLRPAVAALAGVEDACAAAFQTVLRPLLRLLLLGQHVAPVRCTVERQHRFDSQQRGLRTRCRHWSTCRRYKLVSVVAFQPVLLPLLSSLLLRQHVALLHWTVERGDKLTVRFTAAWAQVALPWRQWGQQSRLTRANHEISILPGSSLRHTKSQSLPLVSCRDATCSHCVAPHVAGHCATPAWKPCRARSMAHPTGMRP